MLESLQLELKNILNYCTVAKVAANLKWKAVWLDGTASGSD